jgi:hypothetical protein
MYHFVPYDVMTLINHAWLDNEQSSKIVNGR